MVSFEGLVGGAAWAALLAVALAFAAASIRVYKEYERGVRFRLGRFSKVIGPGPALALPYIDSTILVDTRSVVIELPNLRALTRDKCTVFIDAIVRYRVSSPALAVTRVANARDSLKAVSETAVRGMVGELGFDSLIEKREFICARLRETVSAEAGSWGLEIEAVELSDVTPSERTMQLIRLREGAQINKRAGNIRGARRKPGKPRRANRRR